MPQKHENTATTTTAASPTMALLRYRVSCLIIALLTVGIARLGYNPVVGAIVLLFEVALLVGGRIGDVGKLGEGAELVGDIELVVVVVTMDNFSWPAVTV